MNRLKIVTVCGAALLIVAAVAVVVASRNRQQPAPPPELPTAQTPAEVCVKRTGNDKSHLAAKARMGVFSRRVPSAPDGCGCTGAAREVVYHQQDPRLRLHPQADMGQWAVVESRMWDG